MHELVDSARRFALWHHNAIGHVRKYTGEPYIEHPRAVVAILKTVPHTPVMLAAAWLHDVVEDTPVSHETIRAAFPAGVAALVEQLTDVSRPSDGNRAARKAIDREHLAQASAQAKTIKLADLIDNTRSIVAHDPAFARVYLREKAQLLTVLTGGDHKLRAYAEIQVASAMMQLGVAA
jgi:(p)ppGpp synthase/HD superfamily hydrolase